MPVESEPLEICLQKIWLPLELCIQEVVVEEPHQPQLHQWTVTFLTVDNVQETTTVHNVIEDIELLMVDVKEILKPHLHQPHPQQHNPQLLDHQVAVVTLHVSKDVQLVLLQLGIIV